MARKARPELAQRLKEVAEDEGLTAETMAERLGYTASAVYAWWNGRNEPSIYDLSEYARITNSSLSYLAHGQRPSVEEADRLVELVLRFADRVMDGETAETALSHAALRPDVVTRREARSLDRRLDAMKRKLTTLAGKSWFSLTSEERRETIERLIQELEA